jgi:hypothetical protein
MLSTPKTWLLLPGMLFAAGLFGACPHAFAQQYEPGSEEIRQMNRDAAEQGKAAAAQAREQARAAAEQAKELTREAREQARAAADQGKDLARQAREQAQEAYESAMEIAESALEAAFEDDDVGSLSFLSREVGGASEVVKNAPYSAEAITERTQVLMDGNRIVRKSVTLLARDAAGRTRQERKSERSSVVYINDPVEKRKYVLHPSRKIAVPLPQIGMVSPTPPVPPQPPVPPATMPPGATPPIPPLPPVTGVEVRPGRVVVRKGDGAAGPDVHIEVIRVGSDGAPNAPAPAIPPMPPLMLHGHPLPLPYGMQGKGVTESLGPRDFDGVRAEGTRVTHTIAAGVIGNERPISLVSERWYSPELHLVVMSSTSDPRSGITVYRLANLKRGEPPADLFKVPADYQTRSDRRSGAPKTP